MSKSPKMIMHSPIVLISAVAAGTLLLGACGGGSSSSGSSSSGSSSTPSNSQKPAGTLSLAIVAPLSGADATFGTHAVAACGAATALINKAGGVLNNTLKCVPVDTKGDPADAVPVFEKTLATSSHLVGILGPTSDEAAAVAPLENSANIPFFTTTGQAQFTHTTLKYFHRITVPDTAAGYAMTLWAQHQGYKNVAIVTGNDIGSQGTVKTMQDGLQKLGISVVSHVTLALDQASYQSEVARVVATHPQAILTEEDPQTAATFFGEYKQQLGSTPYPQLIGADPVVDPQWYSAMAQAIGANLVTQNVVAENTIPITSGPAWEIFNAGLNSSTSDPKLLAFSTNPTTEVEYDSTNLMALSMIAANSTDPKTYNARIIEIANGSPGAVDVRSFQDGAAALSKGEKIRYVGMTGPFNFNQYNNSPGGLGIVKYGPSGAVGTVPGSPAIINPQAITKLQG